DIVHTPTAACSCGEPARAYLGGSVFSEGGPADPLVDDGEVAARRSSGFWCSAITCFQRFRRSSELALSRSVRWNSANARCRNDTQESRAFMVVGLMGQRWKATARWHDPPAHAVLAPQSSRERPARLFDLGPIANGRRIG